MPRPPRQSRRGMLRLPRVLQWTRPTSSFPSGRWRQNSAVLVMRVEHALRIGIKQVFAGLQPLSGLGGKPTTVEIQLFDLFEPALELLQIDVVFFELGISEMLRGRFLGDLDFKILTFVDELAVSVIPIGFEAADD